MQRLPALLIPLACAALAASNSPAADSRADFLKLLDRPRVPLAAEVKELPAANGLVQFHFSFASDAQQGVPGLLVKSADSHGRRPVVIVLHGTGGTKQAMLPLLRRLADKGFVAVAMDGRYHGERTKAGKGTAEYDEAILRATRGSGEHPLYYDTAWDLMRLLDYLETRDDVDPKRIGAIGFSKGGIELWLAAAADTRLAAVVPCISVQSFRWALDNDVWQQRISTVQAAFDAAAKDAGVTKPDAAFVRKFYDRLIPGIYGEFDGPSMLPLIAPRPLLVINGETDARNPLPALKLCTDAAKAKYYATGADDHFKVSIEEKVGHKVTPESEAMAVDWFVKWLKP